MKVMINIMMIKMITNNQMMREVMIVAVVVAVVMKDQVNIRFKSRNNL